MIRSWIPGFIFLLVLAGCGGRTAQPPERVTEQEKADAALSIGDIAAKAEDALSQARQKEWGLYAPRKLDELEKSVAKVRDATERGNRKRATEELMRTEKIMTEGGAVVAAVKTELDEELQLRARLRELKAEDAYPKEYEQVATKLRDLIVKAGEGKPEQILKEKGALNARMLALEVKVIRFRALNDVEIMLGEAKKKGARILAISNVLESSIPRLADHSFYTHAGPEIGVASTKAFTTQLVGMMLLAIYLGRRTGTLSPERARELLAELVQLPNKMRDVVESGAQLQVLARRYGHGNGFLFLGRGAQYPIALEGALKLKEISYIHAEGYAAGEMKHGPIALIDEHLPVVVLAPRGPHYEKVVSNLAEVRARQGKVLAVATKGDAEIGGHADDVILVPDSALELQPILTVLPLQLLAYYVADFKGTDIDQPRNLAKSVTVE